MPEQWWERTAASRWAWGCVLLPGVVLIALRWNAGPGLSADDFAQYLLHARALIDGRPYTDTGYIWSPYAVFVGPPAFPPGVPLMLAVLFAITGFSITAAGLLMTLCLLLFALFAGLWVAREQGRAFGLATTLLLGIQEPLLRFSATVNSDLPFCALVWAVFLLADAPGRWSWKRTIGISLLGLLAIATRTVGVVLVPVAILVALVRWRELGWRVAVPAGVWVLLGVGALAASGQGRGLVPTLFRVLLRDGPHLDKAARQYRIAISETLLYPFPWDAANAAWHVAGLVLIVVGLVTWIRQARVCWAVVFAVLYAGILVIVPVAENRYLWPLAPLVLVGLFRGLVMAGRLVRRHAPLRAEPLLAACAALLTLGGTIYVLRLQPPGRFEDLPASQALYRAVRIEAEQAPMRVVFVKPRSLTLATGVPAAGNIPTNAALVLAELRRLCITHVVLGDPERLGPHGDSALRRAVHARDSLFTPVFEGGSYQLIRFDNPACRNN